MSLNKKPLNGYEKVIIVFIFLLIAIGTIGCFISKDWYEQKYADEDGFIEWLTVLPLIIACITAIAYLAKVGGKRSWFFKLTMILIAVFSFFVSGEEISWGQRLFGIKTSEYFIKHNAQHEMNLHNLILSDGEKVNKLIFTTILGIMVGIYLVVFPLLYNKVQKFQQFINWAGIPIARIYQIIVVVGIGLTTSICPSGKRAEMLEFGVCFAFLLIILFPQNKFVFRKNSLDTAV